MPAQGIQNAAHYLSAGLLFGTDIAYIDCRPGIIRIRRDVGLNHSRTILRAEDALLIAVAPAIAPGTYPRLPDYLPNYDSFPFFFVFAFYHVKYL
jgi:hypothetical protein